METGRGAILIRSVTGCRIVAEITLSNGCRPVWERKDRYVNVKWNRR